MSSVSLNLARSVGSNPLDRLTGCLETGLLKEKVDRAFETFFMDEECTVSFVGSCIRVQSSVGSSQRHINVKGKVTAFTANPRAGIVAVATTDVPNPTIYLYTYPSLEDEPKCLKAEGIHLKCTALAVTSDGKRVAAIGNEVSPSIAIYDADTCLPIRGASAKLPQPMLKCSFNPLNNAQLCTTSASSLVVWDVEKSFEQHSLAPSQIESRYSEQDISILCHAWTSSNEIYVGDSKGHVALFNAAEKEGSEAHKVSEDGEAITALLLTKRHLIVSLEGGILCWVDYKTQKLSQSMRLQEVDVASASSMIRKSVCCFAPSPKYDRAICLTLDGAMTEIETRVDDGEDAEPPIPREISASHGESVCGVVPLHANGGAPYFVSASTDGVLSIFNGTSFACVNSVVLDECCGVYSLVASPFSCIVVVGDEKGYISLISINAPIGAITTLYKAKAHKSAVTSVAFNHDGTMLATASSMDNFVCVFRISEGLELAGTCPTNTTVKNLAWGGRKRDPDSIYVSALGDSMSKINSTTFEIEDLKGESRASCSVRILNDLVSAPIGGLNIECRAVAPDGALGPVVEVGVSPAHSRAVTAMCGSPAGDFLASGSADGAVALWCLNNGAWTVAASMKVHGRAITCLTFNSDGTRIYSACCGGLVTAYDIPGAQKAAPQIDLASETDLKEKAAAATLQRGIYAFPNAQGKKVDTMCLHEREVEAVKAEEEKHNEKVKENFRRRVESFKGRLGKLLEHNEQVVDLEKLERGDFIIDLEGQRILKETNQTLVDAAVASIMEERAKCTIIARRLKEETWDKMLVQAQKLLAFRSGVVVRNFPIEKDSGRSKLAQKVINMRKLELRETRKMNLNGWTGRADFLPEDAEYIINAASGLPEIDAMSTENATKRVKRRSSSVMMPPTTPGGNLADDLGDNEDGDETFDHANEDILDLLYHPLEIRTSVQRKNQAILIGEIIRSMKEKYNEHFSALYAQKETEVDKIKSKNERMREIIAELNSNEGVFEPTWDASEQPKRLINVTPEEVPFEKYLSKEERARLKREEEERLAREANQTGDNMEERALSDMMGGSLEVQQTANDLQNALVRESWMDDLTPDQMTDEQRQLLEEYEAKLKKINEDMEKQRKALELEFKKLRSEVNDIASNFDEKVEKLFFLKSRVLKNIRVQQLYEAKLQMLALRQQNIRIEMERGAQKLEELAIERETSREKIKIFQKRLISTSSAVDRLVSEDKAMDRAFRESINSRSPSPLDLDVLKMLQQLYRQRGISASKKNNASRRGSSYRSSFKRKSSVFMSRNVSRSFVRSTTAAASAAKMAEAIKGAVQVEDFDDEEEETADPFADAGEDAEKDKESKEREVMLAPLDRFEDLPDGFEIDDATFDALNALRTKKIEHEIVVKEKQQELQGMQKHLDALKVKLSKCDAHIVANTEKLKSLKEELRFSNEDMEVMVALNQGQDEIPQQPIISDYKGALLLPRDAVEKLNAAVRELGASKIDTMNKMKDFRKNINFMQWERNYLDMQTKDLEEHYTDLHMLRMTRQLNEFLKGSDPSDRHKKETLKLEKKMTHMKSSHQQKLQKIADEVDTVTKKTTKLESDNAKLLEQHGELKSSVAVRETICRSKENQTGGASEDTAAQARMKAVVTRRKLMDLARAQTDEIEFLRSELDRLRQRTFPSFARAKADAVVQYPDEH